jgi:hypothetical protein
LLAISVDAAQGAAPDSDGKTDCELDAATIGTPDCELLSTDAANETTVVCQPIIATSEVKSAEPNPLFRSLDITKAASINRSSLSFFEKLRNPETVLQETGKSGIKDLTEKEW